METTPETTTKQAIRPRILFRQPLFLRELIQDHYEDRDRFLKSLPELEAAYTLASSDSKLADFKHSPAAVQRALKAYNDIVIDGRYVEVLRTDPAAAAENLGIAIDAEALTVLQQGITLKGADSRVNEFTVVTAIVVLVAESSAAGEIVIDYSKTVEFKP